MDRLHGQIKLNRLYGDVNLVPSSVSSANLTPLTIYPSHDEQVFSVGEGDEFDGYSVVTAKPVPREPVVQVGIAANKLIKGQIDIPVNIGVSVGVSAEHWQAYAYYNGVRLPRIQDSVLASYPYAFIGLVQSTGKYQVLASTKSMYYSGGAMRRQNSNSEPFIWCLADDAVWTTGSSGNYSWTINDDRILIWSNHDIPNGSADATEIYFTGSAPVLTD